jgi:hypothetical protein
MHTARPINASELSDSDVRRFFRKVAISNTADCWLWQGALGDGYGLFTMASGPRLRCAHRVSYALAHLEAPADMFVLHRCDTPACVNPDHLFLGTHLDNMKDRSAKGRTPPQKGETNNSSKLDTWDVICIRADRRAQKRIAADFGISQATVSEIKSRQRWAHVSEFTV